MDRAKEAEAMQARRIHTKEDLSVLIQEVGILPFFHNSVPGWCVEDHIDPAVWFTDQEGPWEWKGPLAADRICVYGKFIRGKAAFISPEWFADLANYRRDGYDWEGFSDDGLAPYKDRLLMSYLDAHHYVLSKYAKRECGFSKGYDAVLTRLQMQTYVITADFQYSVTRDGKPYGWGNAVIDLPERWLGERILFMPEKRSPQASFDRMLRHLLSVLPGASEDALRKELK